MFICRINTKQTCSRRHVLQKIWLPDTVQLIEEEIKKQEASRKERMCCSTENVLVAYILTYNKATFRANHIPSSVVLHQYGIGVIGTLNSGKGQRISATDTEQQLGDIKIVKNRVKKTKENKSTFCSYEETKNWRVAASSVQLKKKYQIKSHLKKDS